MIARRLIEIAGVVQGIGFRPFVYRIARASSLTGHVQNEAGGVVMELQGEVANLDRFEQRLIAELPPGGRIERIARRLMPPVSSETDFEIRQSRTAQEIVISLAPDRFVCADCLREMKDPSDRRYRYPFINCTACGPRYTIAVALPYDRPNTTMTAFEMCDDCRTEYLNPEDRRYHAQPIACPVCGPSVSLVLPGEMTTIIDDPGEALSRGAALLRTGRILAVKGIGGFHLAVDASNEEAVRRLRVLKRRSRKPLGLMARDLDTARRIVQLDSESEALLCSPGAPIVLAPKREFSKLAEWIAPGLDDLGVMLPYSPLHHLLFEEGLALLVMTSGNHPSEPITTDNEEAVARLRADGYLVHNRDIHVANDDSVVRTAPRGPAFVRRSRGYVPEPFHVPALPRRSVLALGAELKVTVATLHAGQLVVGRHLGDLDNLRAEEAFVAEVARMMRFAAFDPQAIAVDLHPDLASTRFAAERFAGIPICRVQHHHAHMAAVMMEHGLGGDARVAGIILDGFGLGTDGAVWGGEVLVGGYSETKRVAHLRYVPLPGGDRAALEPGRMATSYLVDAGLTATDHPAFNPDIAAICGIKSASPLTSSAGRLFDGVAAILGIAPDRQEYEGEAAARLEAAADATCTDAYSLPLNGDVLDTRALICAVVGDAAEVPRRAARFINGLADGLAHAVMTTTYDQVVFGGGCLINRLLLGRLISRVESSGKTVLTPRRLPAGDGGLSAGQAACAACATE